MNLEQLTDDEFDLLEKKVKNERIRRDKKKYEEDQIIRTKYEGKLYNLYILLKKHKKFKEKSEENLFNDKILDNLFNSLINAMYNHHAKVHLNYNAGFPRSYSGSNNFHINKDIRDILDKLEENLKTNVLDALSNKFEENQESSPVPKSESKPVPRPTTSSRARKFFGLGGSNKKYKRCKTKRKY